MSHHAQEWFLQNALVWKADKLRGLVYPHPYTSLSILHIRGCGEEHLLLAGVTCSLQEPREGASGLSLHYFSPG